MIISKRKKFILSFVSLLSCFSLLYIFPASAFSVGYFEASSIEYVGGSSAFDNIRFMLLEAPGSYGYNISNNSYRLDRLGVFDLVFSVNSDYLGSSGTLSFTAVANGQTPSSSNSYVTFFNINFDRPFTEGEGFSFRGKANTPVQSIKVSVPVKNLGSYFYVRFNHYCNYVNANLYLTDVEFSYDYSQPDSEISSGIGDVEAGESSIISGAEGNYNSQITSGNNTVLSFFKSAGNSLSFVKTMFNNLVSDKVYILVIASIMLAILPVLINVAGGFRK